MTTSERLSGRCLCGAVELELIPPTDFLAHCHCRSCRLAHGAAFVTWTSVPEERFRLRSGEDRLGWYQSSEWIRWGFCRTCGSSLVYRAVCEGHPEAPGTDRVYVAAGCLEGELDRRPAAHVSYEERAPWMDVREELPCYRGKGEEELEG